MIKYSTKEIEKRAIEIEEVCKSYGRYQFHDCCYLNLSMLFISRFYA